MPGRSRAALVLVALAGLACGGGDEVAAGADATEVAPPSEAVAAAVMLPPIELVAAPGVEPGTAVHARGIRVGEVASARLNGQRVALTVELEPGHAPSLAADACVRVETGGDSPVVVIETGKGDAVEHEVLENCEGEGVGAHEAAGEERAVEEEPTGAEPPVAAEHEDRPKKKKPRNRRSQRSCGDDLSFATLSVSEVAPQGLHLPDGGWRAKIRFENAGSRFVEIDPVSMAAFMDRSGASLPVATLPASSDWFMPFELPPHSKKVVTVTFHDDGGGKPWVHRIKYSYVCD